MNSHATLARRIAAALLLVFLCAEGLVLSISYWNRLRAEELLRQIGNLKTGYSTQADVERIVRNYNGHEAPSYITSCVGAEASFSAGVSNQTLMKLEMAHPWLRWFGARPWRASAMFSLRQNKLCYAVYQVDSWPQDNDGLQLSPVLVLAPSQDDLFIAVGDKENHRYGIIRSVIRHTIHELSVAITPDATASERSHAFDLDLSCLTSLRPCQTVSQFMPAVWRDYVARLEAQGETFNGIDQ
jgi:hypothetical protein